MTRASMSMRKDRKILRRVDLGAARTSITGGLAALAVFVLVAWGGGLYAEYEGLTLGLAVGVVLVTGYRLLIAARFEGLYASGPARWRRLFSIGLIMHGLLWGGILALVGHLYGIGFNLFAVLIYNVGIATAISSSWLAALAVRQLFMLCLLAPGVLVLVLRGGAQEWLLAVLLAVYLGYLYRLFATLYETFWHAVARERRAQGLADEDETLPPHPRSREIQLNLVYRLAHELRTPMTSMLGMMTLLKDTELTEEQREYYLVAAQSGKLMMALIDDVLDYGRILTGRIVLNPEYFDLRATLEQSLDAYGHIAQSKGVELTGALSRSLPRRVNTDRERFRQILNNLLSNAVKFTEHGEVCLEVEFEPDAVQGGTLTCRVRDEGCGMTPEVAAQLFEDQLTASPDTSLLTRKGGFGLLVCKGLATAMGGQIGVESTPGEGSTFWFSLPVEAQPDLVDRPAMRRHLRDQRVWVVGAASGTAQVLREELEFFDARVELIDAYGSVLERLRHAHELKQDVGLVVIDTWARRESALHLCEAILADPALQTTHVLFAGDVDERGHDSLLRLVQTRGLPVLTKPVHRSALRRQLAALWGLEGATDDEDGVYEEGAEEHAQRSALRLLVVEDDAINRQVICAMLNRLGYHPLVAESAEAAQALLDRERFDLLLVDCVLPGMDGLELTRRIREAERRAREAATHPVHVASLVEEQRLPIVAMTAHLVEGIEARCLAAGMDDFLAKPINLSELDTVLRHWLPLQAPLPENGDEL